MIWGRGPLPQQPTWLIITTSSSTSSSSSLSAYNDESSWYFFSPLSSTTTAGLNNNNDGTTAILRYASSIPPGQIRSGPTRLWAWKEKQIIESDHRAQLEDSSSLLDACGPFRVKLRGVEGSASMASSLHPTLWAHDDDPVHHKTGFNFFFFSPSSSCIDLRVEINFSRLLLPWW